MTVFISQHKKLIDKRGRVTVPHDFRDELNVEEFKGFVAFASYKNMAIECCGISKMQKLAEKVDEDDGSTFFNDDDSVVASIFADSYKILFDDAGRVIIPEDLLEHSGISAEVLFVGIGKTFQIWDPEKFKEYRQMKKSNLLNANNGAS